MSGEDEAELTREQESREGGEESQHQDGGEHIADASETDQTRAVEAAATSFVELEEELGHLGEGMEARGQAIDVERIPVEEVPDEYPADIETADALALVLELVDADEQTVTVYFEWPERGTDDRLAKLLALRDVPIDRFADLHGETILLTVTDGHYVPALPEEDPRGSAYGIYGVYAGLGINLLVTASAILGLGTIVASGGFVLLWLVLNLVVLPLGTYLDAWDLRTKTDWDGGPLFWGTLAAVPGLNILVGAAYLIQRESAQPYI